ncbi:MAG: hypothetical protein ACXVRJ_05670 [Gaiellaceae bacterium]
MNRLLGGSVQGLAGKVVRSRRPSAGNARRADSFEATASASDPREGAAGGPGGPEVDSPEGFLEHPELLGFIEILGLPWRSRLLALAFLLLPGILFVILALRGDLS